MRPRVYIETTIPSYLTAGPTTDATRALNQQLTRDWWDTRRQDFELCVSQFVLDECGKGNSNAARLRLEVLEGVVLLESGVRVLDLAAEIVAAGALPPKGATDASHIALAAVHGVSYLLTWNCKHIANPSLWPSFERLCGRRGLKLPAIVTPAQFTELFP